MNWRLWLQDSEVRLSQLAKIVAQYMVRKESGDSDVKLEDYLRDLQWYWRQQEQRTHYSDLTEEQQKQLETIRKFLSSCEHNANTQVQYIIIVHRVYSIYWYICVRIISDKELTNAADAKVATRHNYRGTNILKVLNKIIDWLCISYIR